MDRKSISVDDDVIVRYTMDAQYIFILYLYGYTKFNDYMLNTLTTYQHKLVCEYWSNIINSPIFTSQ